MKNKMIGLLMIFPIFLVMFLVSYLVGFKLFFGTLLIALVLGFVVISISLLFVFGVKKLSE